VVITFLFLYWMTCPGSGISFRDLASWIGASIQHSGRFFLLTAYTFIFFLWKLPVGVVSFLLSSPVSYLFLALWVVSATCYQRTKKSAGELIPCLPGFLLIFGLGEKDKTDEGKRKASRLFEDKRLGIKALLSPLITPMATAVMLWMIVTRCCTFTSNSIANNCNLVQEGLLGITIFISDAFALTDESRQNLKVVMDLIVDTLRGANEADLWNFFTRRGGDSMLALTLYGLFRYLIMLKMLVLCISNVLAWVQVWLEFVEDGIDGFLKYLRQIFPKNSQIAWLANAIDILSEGSEVLGILYTRYLLEGMILPASEVIFSPVNGILSLVPMSSLLYHPQAYKTTHKKTLSSAFTPMNKETPWKVLKLFLRGIICGRKRMSYLAAGCETRTWRLLVAGVLLRLAYLFVTDLCRSAVSWLVFPLLMVVFFPRRLLSCPCPDHDPHSAYKVVRI